MNTAAAQPRVSSHASSQAIGHRVITNEVIKDRVTFLQRTDGQGSPTVLEIGFELGGSNAPHIHASYHETFTAVRGTLGLRALFTSLEGARDAPSSFVTRPVAASTRFARPERRVLFPRFK